MKTFWDFEHVILEQAPGLSFLLPQQYQKDPRLVSFRIVRLGINFFRITIFLFVYIAFL